jgi:hypothetical protein
MAIALQQATARTLKSWQFLDATDAVTPETGLTIQKADVRLTLADGNIVAANADQGASDAGAPHDELGKYDLSLDATDTATRGRLVVTINKSGALPVEIECDVLDPDAWWRHIGGTFNERGGRIWFVDTVSGNDANSGTKNSPLATFAQAHTSKAPEDDIVQVATGAGLTRTFLFHLGDDADSGTAVRAALTAGVPGEHVFVGPGDFDFGSTTTLALPDGVHLSGAGWTNTAFQIAGTSRHALDVGSGCYVSDLEADSAGLVSHAVDVTGESDVIFERVRANCSGGVDGFYLSNAHRIWIKDCYGFSGFDGIAGQNGSSDVFMLSSAFASDGSTGTVPNAVNWTNNSVRGVMRDLSLSTIVAIDNDAGIGGLTIAGSAVADNVTVQCSQGNAGSAGNALGINVTSGGHLAISNSTSRTATAGSGSPLDVSVATGGTCIESNVNYVTTGGTGSLQHARADNRDGQDITTPGDEMDLPDAPNPTAVTAIQAGLGTAADMSLIKAATYDLALTGSVNDASATTTSFVGNAELSATDDLYSGAALVPTSGVLQGVARKITDYDGTSTTITVGTAWPSAPANGVTFTILGRIE